MTNKATKYGLMTIAAVLLVAMAFAGTGSAESIAPEFAVSTTVEGYDGSVYTPSIDVSDAYLIQNESNWRYVVDDINTDASSLYKNANLVITQDIVFTADIVSLGNVSDKPFSGKIYGNGSKFINFTQSGTEAHGLIYYAADGCELNYVQMTDSNIVSENSQVGGLIGYATLGDVKVSGCSVVLSNITSTGCDIGGLIGYVEATSSKTLYINASSVNRVYLHSSITSTSAHIGGLLGGAQTASTATSSPVNVWITTSQVNGSEICASKDSVGGVIGYASSTPTLGSSLHVNATVTDCKIWSDNNYVGGVIGYVIPNIPVYIDICSVDNCVISGSSYIGGVVGRGVSTGPTFMQETTNIYFGDKTAWVNKTWINGSSQIGSIIGFVKASETSKVTGNPAYSSTFNGTAGVLSSNTYGFSNAFNNSVPKTLEAALADGIGTETGHNLTAGKDYGYTTYALTVNNDGHGTASAPLNAYAKGTTVKLTAEPNPGYIFSEWVSDEVTVVDNEFTMPAQDVTVTAHFVPESYGINITNATGTYPLTSALTTVYGDDPATDGTAVLTFENSKPVLTLNRFKASNTTGNVPIINASVANLTIKLAGESNLTGSYADFDSGLLFSSGNLTIKGTDDSSKLLVNNTNSTGNFVYSILVCQDLTIDDAKVTVIANGGTATVCGINIINNLTITGSKTVVDVNATSGNSIACSIQSSTKIIIDSSAKVTAKAQASGGAYALFSEGGNVSIGSSAVVEANATSASGSAYSINAKQNLNITSATKVNTTAETQGSNQYAYGLYADGGNITITGSPDVTASTTALASGSKATSMRALYDIAILSSTTVVHSDANSYSRGIYAESGKLTISDSDVTAFVNSTSEAYALVTADNYADITITGSKVYANANSTGLFAAGISTSHGCKVNITISSSSEVTSIANSSNSAYAMFSGGDITIDGIKSLTAIGTTTSFGYNCSEPGTGKLNIDGLATGYTFSNASVSGAEPKLYTTFANPNNWHIDSEMGSHVSNYTAVLIEKKSTPTPSYSSSSSRQTGYTQILQAPVQDVTTDPTPANQQTADISLQYLGMNVFGTSVSDLEALNTQNPQSAAQVEAAFAAAQAAGIPLTNSKGAGAVFTTTQDISGVEKVTFSRVYDISSANEGEELSKVIVTVPKSDVEAKGLTSDDVTIYHYLEIYNIWVPLETISVSQDETSYYYTAATDGNSPFGVLIKKIENEPVAQPTTQATQQSPAPFVGLLAGLGAAAVLLRLRK